MKLGVISDLHIDRNQNEYDTVADFEHMLANEVMTNHLDLLLIAGDISNDHLLTIQFVEQLKALTKKPILFVPGNHDYWGTSNTSSVLDIFKQHQDCLIEKPYELNDQWAIVGHSGWYDYTFANPRFSKEELTVKNYNERTWQDHIYTNWQLDDPSLSKLFANQVEQDIHKTKGKNIICMTHIVTNQAFSVPMPHPVFDYFNAFIGTSDFMSMYQRLPIKYAIMGHVHYRKSIVEDGITYICACLGNRKEWKTDHLQREIQDALQIISIE